MDQHPDVRASDGWRAAISDSQAERAQLRNQVDQLYKIIDRLHALRRGYEELVKRARQDLQESTLLTER